MTKKSTIDQKSPGLHDEVVAPPPVDTVVVSPPAPRAAPLPPNYVGYPNLRYAYLALIAMGDTAQNAAEYLETMITLAGPYRDTRTYIDNGSSPRRLLNVGAARLQQV